MQWYEHLGLGCPQFALSEFPTVAKQLRISFFPHVIIVYRPQLEVSMHYLQIV